MPSSGKLSQHVTGNPFRELSFASPAQKEIFDSGPTPILASGGWGAGKTAGFVLKVLAISDMFPGNRGVIIRRVWEEMKQTTMATFYKICPPEAYSKGRRADSEKYLRLNNGSEILWMYMDDPEAATILGGLEINWFMIDQAEDIDEKSFDDLLGRLGRWDKAQIPNWLLEREAAAGREWQWRNPKTGAPIVPVYAMLTCNPSDETHWLYRRFHEESEEHWEKRIPTRTGELQSYHDLGYKMVHMPSYDNAFLPEQNLNQLYAHDSSWVRRFVEAKWGIPEGKIHHVSNLSIIPGDAGFIELLLRTCSLHRVLDHGDTAPTACTWFAVDKDGNIFAFREYYVPNKLISHHRAEITSLSAGERYETNLADPNIFIKFSQRQGGRFSVADEYSDCVTQDPRTALHWIRGDNNEIGTRNRINEYLYVHPDKIHPYTKERGSPSLFFVVRSDEWPQGIVNVLKETRAARRVRLGMDLGRPTFSDERDDKVSDHGYDTVRYFIASRPARARVPGLILQPNAFRAVQQRTQKLYRGQGLARLDIRRSNFGRRYR